MQEELDAQERRTPPKEVLMPEDDDDRVRTAQRNVDLGRPDGFAPGRGFNAYLPQPRRLGLRFAVNVW